MEESDNFFKSMQQSLQDWKALNHNTLLPFTLRPWSEMQENINQ